MSKPRTTRCRYLPAALVAMLVVGVVLSPLQAQTSTNGSPDASPPVIELEPLTEAVADLSQVFSAQVADDRSLESVSLHYRRDGRQIFTRAPMKPIGESGFYSVTLQTDVDDLRAFEYYVQAIDEGGNRTVFGFAFDPLRRELLTAGYSAASPAPPRNAPETIASSTAKPSGLPEASTSNRRWWAIALGVIAVGAVAALASDSGSGNDSPTAPLRIDLQEP